MKISKGGEQPAFCCVLDAAPNVCDSGTILHVAPRDSSFSLLLDLIFGFLVFWWWDWSFNRQQSFMWVSGATGTWVASLGNAGQSNQNSLLLKQRMVDATWYTPSLTIKDNRDVERETYKEKVSHQIQLCEISVCLSGTRVGKEACLWRNWNLKALNFYTQGVKE